MTHEIVIIGAGFSGLAAAIRLKRAGLHDFVILERGAEVGGVWRDNTYPGVAVDIPSFTYSYDFEPNPGWSRIFAPGAELQQYAMHCADRYDIRPHLRLGHEVKAAWFDESDHHWRLTLADGDVVTSRFLISCHGPLVTPVKPAIPGLDDFRGRTISTMRWDHAHDLAGGRVAVIGTGASALQVIPSIAPRVSRLTVYQRTPIWVLPKVNPPVNRLAQGVLRHTPLLQKALRLGTSALSEAVLTLGAVHHEEFPLLVQSIEQAGRAYLHAQIRDRALRDKLMPRYAFGCKRPSFSNSYYPTFLRDNVELVTDGITAVTPTGIRTINGTQRDIDTLILATGFKVFDVPYDLHGTSGETLNDLWDRSGKQTYEGTTVHGYPNLFLSPGPYGVAGPSLFTTFDLCCTHAIRVISAARSRGATRVEIRAGAHERFLAHVRARAKHTMFLNPACAGANSYYVDHHGHAPFLRPTSGPNAWWAQRTFPVDDYQYARR